MYPHKFATMSAARRSQSTRHSVTAISVETITILPVRQQRATKSLTACRPNRTAKHWLQCWWFDGFQFGWWWLCMKIHQFFVASGASPFSGEFVRSSLSRRCVVVVCWVGLSLSVVIEGHASPWWSVTVMSNGGLLFDYGKLHGCFDLNNQLHSNGSKTTGTWKKNIWIEKGCSGNAL